MKKPNFYAWLILPAVLLLGYITALPLVTKWLTEQSNLSTAASALAFVIPIVICFLIAMIIAGRAEKKTSEWVRMYGIDEVTKVKLLTVDRHRPTGNDLTNPHGTYRFMGFYKGSSKVTIECRPGDPEFQALIAKIAGSRAERDTHITQTQIIAVNNNTFTDTRQRISITKALIGGMLAGEAGFILGGASGGSRSVSRPGENIYTFVVFYDDAPPVTEKVKESEQRFKYLVSKLKADE